MASIADDPDGGRDADVGDSLAAAALSLARVFGRGGTLWCIAPEQPEHARHIAVEFVHPVLVGKRALPAVSIAGWDPAAILRPLVRAGDAVIAVSRIDSVPTVAVMRRAEAWGATTIWIGSGPRPAMRQADHILWVDEEAGDEIGEETGEEPGDGDGPASRDGRLVLLYHVLWELTHVCFEHPGLLAASEGCDGGEVCVTCTDEGRLGEVIDPDGPGAARVRTARGLETIDTTIVDALERGDLVLIHAGTAIAVMP